MDHSPTLDPDATIGGAVNPLRMSLPAGLRPPPAQRGADGEEDAPSPMRTAIGSSPRRVEVGAGLGGSSALSLARSPLDAHSSNRGDGGDSNWSPSMLLRPTPLLVLSCLLVALAVSNLVIGLGGGGGHECFDLGAFLIWSAVVAGATLPALHVLAAASRAQRRERALRIAGGGPAEDPAEAEAASNPNSGGGGGGGGVLARLLRLSLSSTIRLCLLSLVLLSSLYSFWVIEWLANGACGANRSVRQMALGNVMIYFATLALVALDLLLPRLPTRVTRQLTRNGGKALALLVVLVALIANIAQLESHDADWVDGYHWSYSARDPPCPRSCLGQPSSALRSIICLNSAGEQVAKPYCEHLGFHGYTHPTLQVAMLKECDPLPFDKCKAEFEKYHTNPAAAKPQEIAGGDPRAEAVATTPNSDSSTAAAGPVSPAPASGSAVPSSFPPDGELSRPRLQLKSDPECPRACVTYPEDYTFPGDQDWLRTEVGCWLETEYIRQMDAGVPEPQANGWVPMERCEQFSRWNQVNTQACPPRPCPSFCDPLEAASLIYAGLYFFLLFVLCFSIFYARLARLACFQRTLQATGIAGWASYRATPSAGAAASDEEDTIRIPASALVTPHFTVDDEGGAAEEHKHEHHQVPPPRIPAAAPTSAAATGSDASTGSGFSGLPSVSHTLVLGFRALFLSPDGWRPWWRHILFLFSALALAGLSVYAVLTLFWLLQAHCRDFIISAILNAGLTCLAALLLLSLAFQRRASLVHRETNPFESIGLLDEGVDSLADTEGAGEGEEDIEFGLSTATLSSRTRRAGE